MSYLRLAGDWLEVHNDAFSQATGNSATRRMRLGDKAMCEADGGTYAYAAQRT
jgi:hypothetical protein